jgi:hypothetical protein
VYALAITGNATFGFTFAFSGDINSNDHYSFVVEGKGGAAIQQEVSSEGVSTPSQEIRKRGTNKFATWLLGK